ITFTSAIFWLVYFSTVGKPIPSEKLRYLEKSCARSMGAVRSKVIRQKNSGRMVFIFMSNEVLRTCNRCPRALKERQALCWYDGMLNYNRLIHLTCQVITATISIS